MIQVVRNITVIVVEYACASIHLNFRATFVKVFSFAFDVMLTAVIQVMTALSCFFSRSASIRSRNCNSGCMHDDAITLCSPWRRCCDQYSL